MQTATPEQLRDLMEQTWSSVDEVCSSLAPADWERPTDCPGWSVKDQVSHLIGTESLLLGRRPAGGAPDDGAAPHVLNPIGEMNEREVAARRAHEASAVLAEYREAVAERARALGALTPEEWEKETPGPLGAVPMRDLISIRILDVFTHEQDIRRATGRPGHLGGGCAAHTFERLAAALPMIVAKRAAAPEGSVVRFDVAAPGRTVHVAVQGGRGAAVEDPPTPPAVRLSMDIETFLCLAAGRWSADRALEEGRVAVAGDADLGRRILDAMGVVP